MTSDSLRRLLVLALAGAALLLQPLLAKFGLPTLDAAHALSLSGVVIGYLMQSGLKSALDKASQNKALGTLLAGGAKLEDVLKQLQAASALANGQAAGSAPSPGASNA